MCFFIKKLINFVKKINFQKIVKKLGCFRVMLQIVCQQIFYTSISKNKNTVFLKE